MVVGFPEGALFLFSGKTSSGSSFFGLLFFKESLLRGEFRFSLFEVGDGGGMSGSGTGAGNMPQLGAAPVQYMQVPSLAARSPAGCG